MPRRICSPRTSSTVTTMLLPITTDSPGRRVSTSMRSPPYRRPDGPLTTASERTTARSGEGDRGPDGPLGVGQHHLATLERVAVHDEGAEQVEVHDVGIARQRDRAEHDGVVGRLQLQLLALEL